MHTITRLSAGLCLGIALAASVQVANADVWAEKKSTLTVTERIEVPGAVLEPGTYIIKVAETQSNRNIVQITNTDENKIFATAIATPHANAERAPNTMFIYYNTAAGTPKALRTWFAPNDRFGQDLVYPKARATELAAMTHETVPETMEEPVVRTAVVAAPAPVRPAPVAVTETRTTRTDTMVAEAPVRQRRLPKTASPYSVWLVVGLLSVAAAISLRSMPRRTA